LKLLLDEMYPATLAESLRAVDIDADTVVEELGLAGRSDPDIFAAAVERGCALLTENVADFTHISAEHLTAGQHHAGVLIALSSRFSRRPAGIGRLVTAIRAVSDQQLEDLIVYLQDPPRS
jgi:predicted nuclease of predicted toxin-antitoxin system